MAADQKPSGVIAQLEEGLQSNPLDYQKWTRLLDQVIIKDDEEQVRATFEKYLDLFKFDAKQWGNYINFELNRGDSSRVEKLFATCLPITTDVEICRTYVSYVRRVNDVITGGERARVTVIQAFDFAVNKVGIDIESYDLWKDYLDFYKGWTPGSSWEQQQKNDSIRKLYRRCLVIPNSKIETIWSDYTKWENDVSTPNNASKFIADLSTSYMEARSWNTEWRNVTNNSIRRKLIAHSPTNDPTNTVVDQLGLWYKWIELEKRNGLNLKDFELQNRVGYVYRRATSMLPFVPELWFRYCQYLLSLNEDANRGICVELLTTGFSLNPSSYLLGFQLSELHEKEESFTKAREVFDTLISSLTEKYTKLQDEISKIKGKKIEATPSKRAPEPSADGDSDDEYEAPEPVVQYAEADALKILELEDKAAEMSKAITLVYVKLMALCKRSQGIKEVRSVFKQRKNFKDMGFELYVENALIEFYSDNQKIADKIFDLAMKSFGKDGEFLYAYLGYLILTNSIESIKVFFEVAATNLLKEISSDRETLQLANSNILDQKKKSQQLKKNEYFLKRIIRKYIKFASRFLDLDTVLSLEKRYIQYFPEQDDLALFADRYKSDKLDLIAKYDLGESLAFDSDDDDDDSMEKESDKSVKRRKTNTDNYSPEVTSDRNSSHTNGHLPVPPKPSHLQQQQQQEQQQSHGFVGYSIYSLLQVLPNAGYFGPPSEHVFNSGKLVELFANLTDLPGES